MDGVNSVYETFEKYLGYNPALLVLFFISLYIVIMQEKERRRRYILVCAISMLVIFNDFTRKILGHFTGIATYYRFFWAVPILFVAARAAMIVLENAKEKHWKLLALGLICICIAAGKAGKINMNLSMPENVYNIPTDVVEISRIIQEKKKEERPRVIADLEVLLDLRSYDASLVWGIGRKPYLLAVSGDWYPEGKYQKDMALLRAVILGYQEDTAYIKKALEDKNIDYVVIKSEFEMDHYMKEIGFAEVGRSSTRVIYGKYGE